MEDVDFERTLDYLRENCLASEDQVADRTYIDYRVAKENFDTAQTIVAAEIEEDNVIASEGIAMMRKMQPF